jgi:DNA polymerase III epsilon subunit-like protein
MACTIELGKYLGHGRLSLEKAIDKFDIFRQISHHALHDALATSQLLRHYISEDKQGVQEYLLGKGLEI